MRPALAELVGCIFLSATVIGSGIAGEALSGGNTAIALIANTGATAAMLFVLVTALGPISGAHLNPAVTLVFALRGEITWTRASCYVPMQIVGCVVGTALAHVMFDLDVIQVSTHERSGLGQWVSEAVATFALISTIILVRAARPAAVPAAVALVITAGYWWTASTSFANPAITIARSFSDTFAGIRPTDVVPFMLAQLVGALVALSTSATIGPKNPPAPSLW